MSITTKTTEIHIFIELNYYVLKNLVREEKKKSWILWSLTKMKTHHTQAHGENMKAVLREKCIALSDFMKLERFHINNVTAHLKALK